MKPHLPTSDQNSQLEYVQAALGIVSWFWRPDQGAAQWFGDVSPLLGEPAGSFTGGFDYYLQRMWPADRDAAKRRFRACLKGEINRYQIEERVVWPDGSVHWIEAHGQSAQGADGRTAHMVGVLRDVTVRKRDEQSRLNSESRFQNLIQHAPLAIGMSRGDCLIYANAGFAAMYGYADPSDAVGVPVIQHIALDERGAFEARSRLSETLGTTESSYEIGMRRRDGSEFSGMVALTEVELPDGPAMLVFLHDVSDRVQAQQALRREHLLNRQYLAAAEAPMLVLDANARIVMLNRKGHQLLGYDEGELAGRDWFDLVHPGDESRIRRAAYRSRLSQDDLNGKPFEAGMTTKAGERRLMSWRSTLLRDAAGHTIGTLSSGEDITERRAAEEALKALNAQLEERVRQRTEQLGLSNAALELARDEAEAATRAKSQFLANMSHEIRTPMNAVIGLTDLALRLPQVEGRLREYLHNIQRAAQSLLEVINGILDFSKVEAGRLELSESDFELDELLQHVDSLMRVRASEKRLTLELNADDVRSLRLRGDSIRLGQVLLNLCGNAVKFTDSGLVRLSVQLVGVDAGAARLRFAVFDTGIGIEPSLVERLFRPFDQLDASSTRRHGGTGLGLAISSQLVALMGGQIQVSSTPGVGSEFCFELQMVLAKAPVVRQVTSVAAVADSGRLRGCRILLVEDNELNRLVACDYLERIAGADVSIAETGEAALAALSETEFDVVLMDVQMPVMDGLEATRRLRASHRNARVPVVAMTAHALPSDRERSRAAGMNEHLTKPLDPDALFSVIDRLWSRRAGLEAAPGQRAPAAVTEIQAPSTAGASVPVADTVALSVSLGLQRCLDDTDLYVNIVRRFVQSRADDVDAIRGALATGRPDTVAQVAHTVVSSAAIIGAQGLSDAARHLQIAIDSGNRTAWQELINRFTQLHAQVMDAADEVLRAQTKPADLLLETASRSMSA